MFKYPNKMQVGVENYKIKFVSLDDLNNIQGLNGEQKIEPLDGYLSQVDDTIYVRNDITKINQLQTMIHELVHCIGNEYAVPLDETQTNVFANELTKFIMLLLGSDNIGHKNMTTMTSTGETTVNYIEEYNEEEKELSDVD